MLRADQAFELMKQRAREAQERGWRVPRDLDGQSLQQKYAQDLQNGYSEQQANKRHQQRHRAALHNQGLVRNSLRPSLIHATTVTVVELNTGKIWYNTTGFLHFAALCLLCRSGHWRGVHSYGRSEVLLVWWAMEYQIKDNPISLEIYRNLFSGSKPEMFDCCLQDLSRFLQGWSLLAVLSMGARDVVWSWFSW